MSTKEIHKIRRKFILVSMFSFFVVIFFIGALINGANYLVERSEIEYSLNEILNKKHSLEDDDVLISELQDEFSLEELFSPSYQRNIFYIFTFDDNGRIIISPFLSESNQKFTNVRNGMCLKAEHISNEMREYLRFHREHVFRNE